jgi:hypothetical protein
MFDDHGWKNSTQPKAQLSRLCCSCTLWRSDRSLCSHIFEILRICEARDYIPGARQAPYKTFKRALRKSAGGVWTGSRFHRRTGGCFNWGESNRTTSRRANENDATWLVLLIRLLLFFLIVRGVRSIHFRTINMRPTPQAPSRSHRLTRSNCRVNFLHKRSAHTR